MFQTKHWNLIFFSAVNADSSGEEDSDDDDDIHKGPPETHDLVSKSRVS